VADTLAPPLPIHDEPLITTQEEERISIASNWTLVWWRFRKNVLAVVSTVVLFILILIVLVPDFFATMDPEATNARLAFIPVQRVHWLDEGKIRQTRSGHAQNVVDYG
jgi:peptide/nickel transport system permease protein